MWWIFIKVNRAVLKVISITYTPLCMIMSFYRQSHQICWFLCWNRILIWEIEIIVHECDIMPALKYSIKTQICAIISQLTYITIYKSRTDTFVYCLSFRCPKVTLQRRTTTQIQSIWSLSSTIRVFDRRIIMQYKSYLSRLPLNPQNSKLVPLISSCKRSPWGRPGVSLIKKAANHHTFLHTSFFKLPS